MLKKAFCAWWDTPWVGHHWVAAGLAAVAAVAMRDVSRLLEAVGEGHTYGASVFTQPGNPLDPAHLQAAASGWYSAAIDQPLVWWWLGTHLLVDLFLFIPPVYVLLATLVRAATGSDPTARRLPRVVLALDVVETAVTFVTLLLLQSTGFLLHIIHVLAWLKWLGVGIVAGVIVFGLSSATSSDANFQSAWGGINRARRGGWQPPAVTVTALLVIVVVFATLVALPADGPLEQLPDVVRYLVSGAPSMTRLLAVVSLALFPVAVAVAGVLATTTHPGAQEPKIIKSLPVIVSASVIAVVAFVVAWAIDGHPNFGPAAWVLVPLALYCIRWASGWSADTGAGPGANVGDGDDVVKPPPPANLAERRLTWAGGAAGAVVVAIGIGVLRAALLPILVWDGHAVLWGALAILGVAIAIFAGRYTEQLVISRAGLLAGYPVRIGTFVVVWGAAAWLLFSPRKAHLIGTSGVIAVGLASLALLAGLLAWTARTQLRWEITGELGWARTPWLGLFLAVWLLAGLLDTRGAYHDVRLTDKPAAHTHLTLEAAFEAWRGQQCTPAEGEPQPMLLVAAPGGGIRAAFWTATALDRLVGPADTCGGRSVFALSGVSGGSLGVATWLRSGDGSSTRASEAVAEISRDHALAAGAAALMTRDLIQPFVGVASILEDRAAQFERSWQTATSVFGASGDEGARWSRVARGPWKPVVVLNAASVNDGCRVLVTNTGGLASSERAGNGASTKATQDSADCQAAPRSGRVTGPVSASIDATLTSDKAGNTCRQRDMRVTTAALLSARFPYVTPAGVLRSCHDPDRALYVVDGGYYENSGMLTLLQLHAPLARRVARYNNGRSRDEQIEPWIVMLDNHYRTDRTTPAPARPRQLVAPLRALSAARRTYSQQAMEQQAAVAVACLNAVPACPDEIQSRFVRLAPQQSPAVAAPLGWVLSDASRNGLGRQLKEQLEDEVVRELQGRLDNLVGHPEDG